MELAFDAGLSPRHVSFVETGRSRPSRDAVLAIADALEVPLRERNALLEAAGHAREYPDAPFSADGREHLRSLVAQLLERQEPWFAVALDHRWDILAANATAQASLPTFFSEGRIPGPPNLLRLTLHPRGLRPDIANLAEVEPRLLRLLTREVALRPDDRELAALLEELDGYADRRLHHAAPGAVPLVLNTPAGTARLLTLVMDFADPLDPVMEEVRIETFLPADPESARVMTAGRAVPETG